LILFKSSSSCHAIFIFVIYVSISFDLFLLSIGRDGICLMDRKPGAKKKLFSTTLASEFFKTTVKDAEKICSKKGCFNLRSMCFMVRIFIAPNQESN
jgi:hypothetical protein